MMVIYFVFFSLYHPTKEDLRDKLLDRAEDAGLSVLVLLADTPSFAYRPKEIRNGLSIPPRMSMQNIWQMLLHPVWLFSQLENGLPSFATMRPYLPKKVNLKQDLVRYLNVT